MTARARALAQLGPMPSELGEIMLISVNTFWTILLIVHGLLAIALLGALTHQAVAVLMPVRQAAGGFVTRFRAVPAAGYATAVCALWILTFLMGAWIYTKYRLRPNSDRAGRLLEDPGLFRAEGACRDARPRSASDLLVLLEERTESGIRRRPQIGDRALGLHLLVQLPRRPRPQ